MYVQVLVDVFVKVDKFGLLLIVFIVLFEIFKVFEDLCGQQFGDFFDLNVFDL